MYEIGQTYTEPLAVLCESGMHFCNLLIDTLIYYDAAHAVICEVEAPDEFINKDANSLTTKCCTAKLRIIRELPIEECHYIARKEISKYGIDEPNPRGASYDLIKTNYLRRKAFGELGREFNFRSNDEFYRDEIAIGMGALKKGEQ